MWRKQLLWRKTEWSDGRKRTAWKSARGDWEALSDERAQGETICAVVLTSLEQELSREELLSQQIHLMRERESTLNWTQWDFLLKFIRRKRAPTSRQFLPHHPLFDAMPDKPLMSWAQALKWTCLSIYAETTSFTSTFGCFWCAHTSCQKQLKSNLELQSPRLINNELALVRLPQ